ncbi:LOW QUALITY PROTEIN: uncharacterized protein LOC125303414 [Alosa alosa]|uniref:LOW QUALITY PROTEIN: uncharacterized protein LOC125303414 n=1 Tax=Alosa alosa TaxID=278164 RepID=UPI0020152599|nr:LOW QUALITY PROTEIN: uncharacterized protein LOC125303414 [Alosa alosa]
MSSSDSDYSIDWLASDEEDAESEQGLHQYQRSDCVRRATSSSSATPGVKRCLSPPSSEDSRASSCARHDFCEDSSMVREEEEEEEERSAVGMSDRSTCSSPSSCMGSCDGVAESRREWPGAGVSGGDKPRQPWDAESPKKRLARKRARSSGGPEQREEGPLTPHQSEKDRLFASKCMELQSYIPPLSSILNGLRLGRYRERLSSFQESVAMDRIQRIMGVLQNPHMGERYINIILKVEEMLKSWFPHIKPVQHADKHTSVGEMEPLSKKQKFSPAALARPVVMRRALCVWDLTPPGPYSATNLKWLHTSPICSLTAEHAQGTSLRTTTATAAAAAVPPSQRDQPHAGQRSVLQHGRRQGHCRRRQQQQHHARQNGLTVATAGGAAPAAPGRPPLGKINAPCLERLLKATESIITQRGTGGVTGSGWS